MMIDIRKVKNNFAKNFPDHPLTEIILRTNDMLSEEEFLGVVSVWLQIVDLEEFQLKNEVKLK